MTDPRTVTVAGLSLSLPEGQVARLQSRAEDAKVVDALVDASPDATLAHHRPWIEFTRGINGQADLLVVERDGAALFGLPIHPEGRTLMVGHSGVLFPPEAREAALKRSVRALRALLDANPALGLQGTQSAQARAYDDPDRTARLSWLIEQEALAGPSRWSRLLVWDPEAPAPDLADDPLDHLDGYDAKLRNQIRQADRHGITLDYVEPTDRASALAVYREFTELHGQSWARTGLRPHRVDYWLNLNAAVVDGGGRDLVVLARALEGDLIAAATCHLWGSRALYWAGASLPSGLEARANPYCLHAAVTRSRARGVTTFELGRFSAREASEKEQSITRYKAQFGGTVRRLTTLATPGTRAEWAAHQAYRAQRKLRVWRGGEHHYA